MKNAFKLFEYRGTPVYLKYWFFILLLFTTPYIFISAFIAILVHELAHTKVAKDLGYDVNKVFIDILYGGAEVDSNYVENDKDAIKIVAAGPLSNFILAGISFLGGIAFAYVPIINTFFVSMLIVNLLLGVFNLLPIFPMDGGRILKAILNMVMKNKTKSRIATGVVSAFFSLALLGFSIYIQDFILGFFSLFFILLSYFQITGKEEKKEIN